jgi:rRNA processing protein Krr1/Pno1
MSLHVETFDTGALLVDLKGSQMHQTNRVGRRIFELLEIPRSRENIIRALAEEFDVDRALLTADVDAFLEILTVNDWLEST